MPRKLLLHIILLFLSTGAFAQTDWVLKSNTDGIKVYTAHVPESKFKALRVECTFDATPAQLVSVLLDVNTCTEWVFHTKSIKLLKKPADNEVYYYSEVSLPWPAANRDFVAHLTATQNPETGVITVDGPAINGMEPLKDGIVRVTESKGKWVITPVGHHEVKVEYTLHVNPAGSLPAWLVNLFATDGPMQSFKGLRHQLKKPQYRNASLAFIKN
ncbi:MULTISPECIES: START domain-containing protein [unclassified Mucilaginibacter]|uniref:START domain-containing protein n=1 Tax=unclassified Mucilaginibacter TaxID=2617802 RepID=UPI00095FA08A|nr:MULTISPECIES: START domain-containing protein [unclassified Mucilaginibacter]OJW13237.1 MAG: lipid-binding protein [Mucilaginibacter sp. 44-25]PLW88758.1 MAG: lipid-binding protein [Mucilaginibacter sp.]HEK20447.1 lipid-binding protein [Bacteroidota bacterium]